MTALRVRTDGPDGTRQVAMHVAGVVEPGDVIALSGELGAGKTCFVQGVARGLDVDGPVTSPTFTLLKSYVGRVPIVHVDVYRLDTLQDVLDLGDEVMSPDAVTCIEWGDAVGGLLPDDRLEVEIRVDLRGDHDARILDLEGHGSWAARLGGLRATLDVIHEDGATAC